MEKHHSNVSGFIEEDLTTPKGAGNKRANFASVLKNSMIGSMDDHDMPTDDVFSRL